MSKFYIVLPNIRSCHNVGAFFRTADACGVDKIILCGYTANPPKPQIDKVSLGAEKWISWERYDTALEAIENLKQEEFEVVVLEQTVKSIPLDEYKPSGNVALVLGNEVKGVDKEVLDRIEKHVHIPMYGKKKSLNVSIAGGIALYEINKSLRDNK